MYPIFDIVFLSGVGLAEIFLALFFFKKYQKNSAITAFGFFTLSIGLWVFLNGIAYLFPRGSQIIDIEGRLIFVAAAFIFPFLYIFLKNFPLPTFVSKMQWFWILFPAALISLTVFSNNVIIGFATDTYALTQYGSDFWIYTIYLAFMFSLVLIESWQSYVRKDSAHTRVLKYVFIGLLISGTLGMLNNLLLPYLLHVKEFSWLGSGASIIWLALMGWVLVGD